MQLVGSLTDRTFRMITALLVCCEVEFYSLRSNFVSDWCADTDTGIDIEKALFESKTSETKAEASHSKILYMWKIIEKMKRNLHIFACFHFPKHLLAFYSFIIILPRINTDIKFMSRDSSRLNHIQYHLDAVSMTKNQIESINPLDDFNHYCHVSFIGFRSYGFIGENLD